MDRCSLYDHDHDVELQGHEIYVFGHNFSYICCRLFKYISYCWLWIDGHCMILNLVLILIFKGVGGGMHSPSAMFLVYICYSSLSLMDLAPEFLIYTRLHVSHLSLRLFAILISGYILCKRISALSLYIYCLREF